MTTKHSYNKDNREYVSLSDAYIGHLITGGVIAFVVGLMYCIFSFVFVDLRIDFQRAIVFLTLTVVIAELVVSLLQRPIIVKAQHASPGGFLYAFYEFFVTPAIAFILAFIIFRSILVAGFWAALFGCAVVLVVVMTKPWQRGLSREEIRGKYEDTKEFLWSEARKEHAKRKSDL